MTATKSKPMNMVLSCTGSDNKDQYFAIGSPASFYISIESEDSPIVNSATLPSRHAFRYWTMLELYREVDTALFIKLAKDLLDLYPVTSDVIQSKPDKSYTELESSIFCDTCGFDFEAANDYTNLVHYSGLLDGKLNTHIHLCTSCASKYDIDLTRTFTSYNQPKSNDSI